MSIPRQAIEATGAASASSLPADGGFRKTLAATLVTLFGLVTLGGVVRATDSGLGCPEWPLCGGQVETSAFIELSHRIVAAIAALLVAWVVVLAWRRYRRQPLVFPPAALAFFLIMVQAALGGIAVLTELPGWLVMAHLAMAQIVIACLLVAYVASRPVPSATTAPLEPSGESVDGKGGVTALAPLATATAVAAFALLMAGSYVANTLGATYVCSDSWPLCRGQLLPLDHLSLAHMGHRLGAVVVGLILAALLVQTWRMRQSQPYVWNIARLAGGLFVAQVIAGGAHMWFNFAVPAKVIHLSLATALWISLVVLALTALGLRGRAFIGQGGGETLPIPDKAAGPTFSRRNGGEEAAAQPPAPRAASGLRSLAADHLALTKPTIVLMLLVTALGGVFMAAKGSPPVGITLWVLFGGALAAGGANSINHALEQDVDGLMRRTSRRPVATYRISPRVAMVQGLLLNAVAFALLTVFVNLLTALLTLSATLFYVLVYTSWLKRTSTQNIVIGGAAGAVPPLAGWAAVTGGLDLPAVYLFAIIFFWTPPHFWALSLLLKDDYARAGIPMLPVVRGVPATVRSIMLYSVLLVALTGMFFVLPEVGAVYLMFALPLGALLLLFAWRLWRTAGAQGSKPLYLYSLAYLALLFAGVMIDSSVTL